NPAALAEALFRRLAPDSRIATQILGAGIGRTASGRFAKWQMLTWSQAAAVAFNVTALLTAFLLITFTDLAFGWSTTLALDPAEVSRSGQRFCGRGLSRPCRLVVVHGARDRVLRPLAARRAARVLGMAAAGRNLRAARRRSARRGAARPHGDTGDRDRGRRARERRRRRS